MNSTQINKALELLGNASDELNPLFVRGEEVSDAYEELPQLVELYRYLEGILQ